MTREQVCKNYLKDNDKLLFEVYAFGKLNRVKFIPVILINLLASFLSNGSATDILNDIYIIGVGESNLYLLDLGVHMLKPKNMKPKKVQILDRKSIESVIIDSRCFGITHKITLQAQGDKQVFYANYNEIKQSQLELLSSINKVI